MLTKLPGVYVAEDREQLLVLVSCPSINQALEEHSLSLCVFLMFIPDCQEAIFCMHVCR